MSPMFGLFFSRTGGVRSGECSTSLPLPLSLPLLPSLPLSVSWGVSVAALLSSTRCVVRCPLVYAAAAELTPRLSASSFFLSLSLSHSLSPSLSFNSDREGSVVSASISLSQAKAYKGARTQCVGEGMGLLLFVSLESCWEWKGGKRWSRAVEPTSLTAEWANLSISPSRQPSRTAAASVFQSSTLPPPLLFLALSVSLAVAHSPTLTSVGNVGM